MLLKPFHHIIFLGEFFSAARVSRIILLTQCYCNRESTLRKNVTYKYVGT